MNKKPFLLIVLYISILLNILAGAYYIFFVLERDTPNNENELNLYNQLPENAILIDDWSVYLQDEEGSLIRNEEYEFYAYDAYDQKENLIDSWIKLAIKSKKDNRVTLFHSPVEYSQMVSIKILNEGKILFISYGDNPPQGSSLYSFDTGALIYDVASYGPTFMWGDWFIYVADNLYDTSNLGYAFFDGHIKSTTLMAFNTNTFESKLIESPLIPNSEEQFEDTSLDFFVKIDSLKDNTLYFTTEWTTTYDYDDTGDAIYNSEFKQGKFDLELLNK